MRRMYPSLHREYSWQGDDSSPCYVSVSLHRQSNRDMRPACLPFCGQSLHAAVGLSDALLPVVAWLSCDWPTSSACVILDAASVSASAPLCDNDEDCLPYFHQSRCSRLSVLHQSRSAFQWSDAL